MTFFIICVLFGVISNVFADCGRENGVEKGRVIGGTDVDTNRFPWFGALVLNKNNKTNCGATLITNYYLLTAAHCYFGYQDHKTLYRVVLGTNNICDPPSPSHVFNTDDVRIHERYAYHQPFYDIAIIRLDRSAILFEKVCLPQNMAHVPRMGNIIGYGVTHPNSEKIPCTLQEAKVKIYSRHECLNQSLLTVHDLAPGTICAGNLLGTTDSCQGDSGGPLQYISNNRYYLLGIVSFGNDCAAPGYLSIYTDIPFYKDWIRYYATPKPVGRSPRWWAYIVNTFVSRYIIMDKFV